MSCSFAFFLGPGVIAAVPGRPHEWYPMIKQEFNECGFVASTGLIGGFDRSEE